MSSQWHLHMISRPSTISKNSSQLKAYPPLWCPTMGLHSMEMYSEEFAQEFNFGAHHIITSFPPVQWFHQGHGEEGQECLQENWWISKCSGKSTTSAMRHPYLDKYSFSCWNSSWMTSTRSSHFKTLKTDQHMSDLADSMKYRTHRGNSLTEHIEQTIYECSKWMNKYSSFPTNKGQVPWHGWQEV